MGADINIALSACWSVLDKIGVDFTTGLKDFSDFLRIFRVVTASAK